MRSKEAFKTLAEHYRTPAYTAFVEYINAHYEELKEAGVGVEDTIPLHRNQGAASYLRRILSALSDGMKYEIREHRSGAYNM